MGKERLSSFFEDEEEENDDTVAINVETRGEQDDMIPPSTPISKVMEDAMNFLKANPEGGGQVDIEPSSSHAFFSDINRIGSVADKKDGDNVSNGEDCDELEIAQQLAMALDQFLIQEGGDSGNNNDGYEAVKELMSGGNDVLDVEQLALALDQFLVNDNDGNLEEEGDSNNDGYEAVKELMNGGNDVLDVEQLALALDQFLVNDNDNIEEEDDDVDVNEVSIVKEEGEEEVVNGHQQAQGWTETPKDVQVEKSTNEKQDVGDDAFTFPVNFGAFGESSDSFNGGESDVFFPTSFGTNEKPSVTKKASQRPPKKSKKLTIATSFMTNSSTTVDQHKKLHPKIKICIGGAPELNITKKDTVKEEENLFYINQLSPSVGDKACLLSGSGP